MSLHLQTLHYILSSFFQLTWCLFVRSSFCLSITNFSSDLQIDLGICKWSIPWIYSFTRLWLADCFSLWCNQLNFMRISQTNDFLPYILLDSEGPITGFYSPTPNFSKKGRGLEVHLFFGGGGIFTLEGAKYFISI